MVNNLNKDNILSLVREYAREKHCREPFVGGDKLGYSGRVYDEEEIVNLVDSALEFWLTSGRYTKEFERKLADYIGVKYCLFVNSGSSANLCAFMTLTSPLLGDRAIRRGDEVITVAAGFPTTIAPIVQFGAVPVFVDITIPGYNIDCSLLENAVTDRTKAVILAHTLGNPFDLSRVKSFCEAHNLWLIEDNCDSLGSLYFGKKTGSFGDLATSSFYPPHHITTGEGGAVYTDNPLLAKIAKSMRDWGRDCVCESGQDNLCGHRFDGQYGQLPKGYDHKYVYSHFGYNLKATDLQAAVGVAQLDKIDDFTKKRRANFDKLYNIFKDYEDKFVLPQPEKNSEPSWFGFPLLCKENVDREKVVRFYEENNIQTRMLFAGNITKQPCMKGVSYRSTELKNTDLIMTNLFWLGVYPGLDDNAVSYICDVARKMNSILN
ncbi:MAG: lipopolysaccharide biosynthesis protein RfbH [Ruminococcus sp.]|jgi:CDP-6-deoxy-D-xylo-4-hexulose-3-dehydrase|nr:lipopolysaccharide biosynthesis protein RfbH [Ruminococcus sp.]